MELKNKHIVITGAASGIGLMLLQHLERDNQISVICRPSDGLEKLRKTYPNAAVYQANLADIGSVESAANDLAKTAGSIDILINNAAVQYTPRFTDSNFQYATIRREIDTNFTSVCTLTYLLLPALMAAKRAVILNVNSGLGLTPKTDSAVYCATKGAMNLFSQSLGYQLETTTVTVSQAFLPLVDTKMTKGRGRGKITPQQAVSEILNGLKADKNVINVGKVKLLRILLRLAPRTAARILKQS